MIPIKSAVEEKIHQNHSDINETQGPIHIFFINVCILVGFSLHHAFAVFPAPPFCDRSNEPKPPLPPNSLQTTRIMGGPGSVRPRKAIAVFLWRLSWWRNNLNLRAQTQPVISRVSYNSASRGWNNPSFPMYITSRGPSCVIYIAFCGEEKYKTRGTAGLGKVDTFLIRHPVVSRLTETVHWMTTALKYKPPYPDESLGPQRKGKNVANILAGKNTWNTYYETIIPKCFAHGSGIQPPKLL